MNLSKAKSKKKYRTNYFSTKILGTRVDFINKLNAVNLINNWIKSNKKYQITTPNPEHIVLGNYNYRFRNTINSSALAICDGIGLVAAAKWLDFKKSSSKLKDFSTVRSNYYRLSGIDLMTELCKLATKKKWRVFLLGGKPGVAEKTAKQISIKYKVSSVRYDQGAKIISNETKIEKERVIKKINTFKPHLLFVAYGAPWQEIWIADNLKSLNINIAMGVGGAFDLLAGKTKRAPKLIRNLGLEWLWRLVNQPWRLTRQLNLIKFVYLVLTSKY